MADLVEDMSGPSAMHTTDTRLNRTCEGCRKRKIKCITNATGAGRSSDRCHRCTKLDIECTFNAPAIRRTRKRNETHIREIEQRLEEVWQLVSTKQDLGHWLSSTSRTPESTFDIQSTSLSSSESLKPCSHSYISDGDNVAMDPVAQGLVDEALANELCLNFCTNCLPHYPMILVNIPTSWQSFRQDRPALFRAILAGASGCFRPDLSRTLYRNAEQYVTAQTFLYGQKSLDLIQAALLLATWSRPADKFQDLNFSQLATLAANMLTELRSSNDGHYDLASKSKIPPSSEQLEIARTFAACYLLSSSIAMSYRRSNSLSYSSWVQDCVDVLSSDLCAPIADLRLASWTRLQRLAEEGLAMAGLEEIRPEHATSFSNWAVLEASCDRIKDWNCRLPAELMNSTLGIHYETVLLNFSVPGLQVIHASQDFRPPFAIRPTNPLDYPTQTTLRYIDACSKSLEAARNIAHLFLEFSVQELRQLPVVVYTRIIYAVVVIIKLDILATTASTGTDERDSPPHSALESLHSIVNKLAQASEGSYFPIPAIFHGVLQRLIGWCDEITLSLTEVSDETIEPLKDLSMDSAEQLPLITHQTTDNDNTTSQHVAFDDAYLPQSVEIDVSGGPNHSYYQDPHELSNIIDDPIPWEKLLVDGYGTANLHEM